jgi:hypothetical protein
MAITDRLKHAWNAFTDNDSAQNRPFSGGSGGLMFSRPDRFPRRFSNERSIISSIYNRIAIDVAAVAIEHVRIDDDGLYEETIDSGLNDCLNLRANLDQPGRMFRQDIAQTMLEEGVIAIVPVDTSISPNESGGYDIKTMRVGRITNWHPQHVTVSLYDEQRGVRQDLMLPKSVVAITENPLYSVMNEPNSTLQRLITKLGLLDSVDDQSASGKLDLIIQLPYTIKSEARRQQAQQRREDIEFQLKGSKYGIAYADATEKITQLNRPVDNNLMEQVRYLTDQLYGQLGLTPEIMNGTADEKIMLNYYSRTIEPILDAIVDSMKSTFLTKTARTQGQSVMYFRDVFKFVPIGGQGGIADIADKFSRNQITSSNEIRQGIGMKPRPEPIANSLANPNMPIDKTGVTDPNQLTDPTVAQQPADPVAETMINDLANTSAQVDAVLGGGG